MTETVFGPYDQESLDLQYDMRRRCADDLWRLDDGKETGNAIAAALPCRLDTPFGDKPGERLDIFPAGRPGAPIHMFIHGGYWRSFDKDMFRYIAKPFVATGVTLILNNYDLCPHVTMDEVVRQNRAAIPWIHAHAADFDSDPGKITVSGHSAGGHLTAMLMATDWTEHGLPRDVIRAGCAISGLFDLEPLRRSYLNEDLRMDAATTRRNSPQHHLPDRSNELIIAVGGGETDEFKRQSREFADVWLGKGLPGLYTEILDCNHVVLAGELGKADSPLTQAIFRQIGVA